MNIGVMSGQPRWHADDLKRAACEAGNALTFFSFTDISAQVLDELDCSSRIFAPGLLNDIDCLIVRSMPPGGLEQIVFRMDALAILQDRGVPIINPPKALECAIDKYLSIARLAQAGIPVPRTITTQSYTDAMNGFDFLGGDVVVKPIFGSEGKDIERITDRKLAARKFEQLVADQKVIVMQPFIAHEGWDIRALVIGEEILAIKRENPNDWRTNIKRGATAIPYTLSERQSSLARDAAEVLGAPVAAVDLLVDPAGVDLVLEINAVPGWRALSKTLKVDVARRVIDYCRNAIRLVS